MSEYNIENSIIIPFTKKTGLFVKAGGSTLSGTPEFYNYNSIGGSETLRGYQRNRFYGNQTFYNQNELRWITNFRTYYLNGRLGLYAFLDDGRVWLESEQSDTWHFGYGAGFILSPFNKISLSVSYGMSAEDSNIYFRVLKDL